MYSLNVVGIDFVLVYERKLATDCPELVGRGRVVLTPPRPTCFFVYVNVISSCTARSRSQAFVLPPLSCPSGLLAPHLIHCRRWRRTMCRYFPNVCHCHGSSLCSVTAILPVQLPPPHLNPAPSVYLRKLMLICILQPKRPKTRRRRSVSLPEESASTYRAVRRRKWALKPSARSRNSALYAVIPVSVRLAPTLLRGCNGAFLSRSSSSAGNALRDAAGRLQDLLRGQREGGPSPGLSARPILLRSRLTSSIFN